MERKGKVLSSFFNPQTRFSWLAAFDVLSLIFTSPHRRLVFNDKFTNNDNKFLINFVESYHCPGQGLRGFEL